MTKLEAVLVLETSVPKGRLWVQVPPSAPKHMVDLSDFKVSNYPDGHKHIVSDKDLHGDTALSASIRNFDDLFLVAQIKKIHPELTTLQIKYLVASRCDRRFSPGEAIDLKIVCDFINRLSFENVWVLKPHSQKTIDLLEHSFVWDKTRDLIRMCHEDIRLPSPETKICYISPDAGASRWMDQYHLHPLIQGSKKRDANGAVSGVEFIYRSQYNNDVHDTLQQHIDCPNFVIVDDLCDGGGTFITIAKAIHERAPNAKVYLVVTHAIFSKGISEPFEGHIERIYCTNSFSNWDHPLVRQIKV